MDRAISIANSMVESGTLQLDAALLVSGHTDFKYHLAETVHNNAEKVTESQVRDAISSYITNQAKENIASVRAEERKKTEERLEQQQTVFFEKTAAHEKEMQEKDDRIRELEKQLHQKDVELNKQHDIRSREVNDEKLKRISKIEKLAQTISTSVFYVLASVILIADIIICVIFGIHCWHEYISGGSWWPYVIIELLSFAGIPALVFSKESPCHKVICRIKDHIYSKVYSFLISKL